MTEHKYRTLQEFFDPYNPEHVEEALKYIEFHDFSPGFIPEDVVLANPYGIQMHLFQQAGAVRADFRQQTA